MPFTVLEAGLRSANSGYSVFTEWREHRFPKQTPAAPKPRRFWDVERVSPIRSRLTSKLSSKAKERCVLRAGKLVDLPPFRPKVQKRKGLSHHLPVSATKRKKTVRVYHLISLAASSICLYFLRSST